MWTRVEPDGAEQDQRRGSGVSRRYAMMDQDLMISLAKMMPDAQSAVLLCMVWTIARQQRLKRGPDAGSPVARLSARQLADMSGRPLRTVWHALRQLKNASLIAQEATEPGRKAAYRPTGTSANPEQEKQGRCGD
jgi:hypothetical protein